MLEIEQLEKEWRRYKFKQYRSVIFVAILVIGGTLTTFFWTDLKDLFKHPVSSNPVAIKQTPQKVQPPQNRKMEVASKKTVQTSPQQYVQNTRLQNRPTPTVVNETSPVKQKSREKTKESAVVLNPDTEFLKSFNEMVDEEKKERRARNAEVKHEVIPAIEEKKEKPVQKNLKKSERVETVKNETQSADTFENGPSISTKEKSTEPKKESSLIIQTKQTNNTLDYLIQRFNKNRDPKLATYIAQSFYKKGNYEETVRWSVIANSMEPSNEKSWLLFAQAKVKLGQKDDAIKALHVYLNQYSSKRVKSYLESLEGSL